MTDKPRTALQGAMAQGDPSEVKLGVRVLKCKCGDPWNIHSCRCDEPETHKGQPCPMGNEPCPLALIEEHGTVSYWHKNPFKRLAFWWQKTILGRKVEI